MAVRLDTAELLLRRVRLEQIDKPLAAIVGALKDKKEHRLRAVDLLVRLGLPARDVEPVLRSLFKDQDVDVATRAVEGVIRLRPEQAKELFAVLLDNRDRTGRRSGPRDVFKLLEALCKLEEELPEQDRLKSLMEQLRSLQKSAFVDLMRLDAAIRIAQLGPKAKLATADLIGALDDASPVVRSQALYALKQIGPGAEKAVPRLVVFFKDARQPRDLHQAAGAALKQIAPEKARELGIR